MFKLRNLSVGKKLALLVGIQLIGIVLVLAQTIVHSRTTLLEERKLAVRNVVEASWSIVDHYAKLADAGKLTVAQAREQAAAAVAAQRYARDDYFYIIDTQPVMVMHPFKEDLNGKDLTDFKDPDGTRLFIEMRDVVKRDGAGFVFYRWPRPGADQPVPKVSYVKKFAAWDWIIGSGVYIDDVEAAALASVTKLVVFLLVVAASVTGLAALITRSVTRPLRKTVGVLKDLAEGEGDLTIRLAATSSDEIGELAQRFNIFMDKLHEIISRVRHAANHAVTAADELSSAAKAMSSGTQKQASALEETASSLEEITAAVKQNAGNAGLANELARGSRATAEQGQDVVTSAVAAMETIKEASKRIANIITTIDEIAVQTNLLALNAAVEAARAGEQGRGFAVVASAVRNLAQRSATAATEVKELIHDSVGKVTVGTDLVHRSGQTLADIVLAVQRVTEIIAQITVVSQEQAQGIDEVNSAVAQMDQVVQSTATQTEQMSATAIALADQALKLHALVGRFKLAEDSGFLIAASGNRSAQGQVADDSIREGDFSPVNAGSQL